MTMSAPSRPLKRALLIGCALAALGATAGTADAQAFDGTPTTAFGTVVYNRATPGVETVRLDTNTAVINWRPNSTNFCILPLAVVRRSFAKPTQKARVSLG